MRNLTWLLTIASFATGCGVGSVDADLTKGGPGPARWAHCETGASYRVVPMAIVHPLNFDDQSLPTDSWEDFENPMSLELSDGDGYSLSTIQSYKIDLDMAAGTAIAYFAPAPDWAIDLEANRNPDQPIVGLGDLLAMKSNGDPIERFSLHLTCNSDELLVPPWEDNTVVDVLDHGDGRPFGTPIHHDSTGTELLFQLQYTE
ncbi:MAG: hypothetical protein H6Q90_3590 [Deltaproteobacteria bacterium]|nr:hypothetical protein [Deltaproteobacteria bacterium]